MVFYSYGFGKEAKLKRTPIRDWKEAQFLLEAPVFVVDIETNTEAPSNIWPKDTFGTSYAADITTVAFYAPGHAPVTLDVRGYPEDTDDFIKRVFVRSNYTVIGHYVVFDIRALGGHFDFRLPKGVRVYDTKVMSALLLYGEPERNKGQGQLSLQYQVEQADLFEDEDDRAFYNAMKDYRGNLHQLAEVLRKTPADHVLWRYTRGYPRYEDMTLPSADVKEEHYVITGQEITDLTNFDLSGHAQDILEQYAAMDVIFPYQLYQMHQQFIQDVTKGSVTQRPGVIVPKWDRLPELVDWETKISWVSCNLAANGVDLDIQFAEKKAAEWSVEIEEGIDTVLSLPDSSTPYEAWESDFRVVMWWSRVLDGISGRGTFNDPLRWAHWQFEEVSDFPPQLLSFTDDSEEDDRRRQEWGDWLLAFRPEIKRAAAIKSKPEGWSVPKIDVVDWVRQTCFPDHGTLEGTYLAKLKTDWLTKYYTSSKPLERKDIVNSDLWKPYHLFVVCGIALPDEDELRGEGDLTTKKFVELLEKLHEAAEKDSSIVISWRALALRSDTLSLGKKAIEYYLKRFKVEELGIGPDDDIEEGDGPVFLHYAKLMQSEANYTRAQEFLMHASRDGKIHSVIDRGGTRTGRYSSNSPNLQNINLKTFRGFLIPPPGYVLVELDYSNAENVMGSMIAGDDAFAYACMSGDFHSAMAQTYWPDKWAAAIAADDVETRKKLRSASKPITFAIPYGAGAPKIARQSKLPLEEARRIITARRQRFQQVEKKKEEVAKNCVARWSKGFRPAYVPLWTGRRVIVPTGIDKKTTQEYVVTYKSWNYLQQGGVAEMVARAKVRAYEMLLDEGYLTYIVLNVHDSIILAVKIEEWPDVVQKVVAIMVEQMPAELRERTIPAVHFVTEVGPENAQKWGWQDGVEYPFSLDVFVNYWGVHTLPEEELAKKPHKREAPTWYGPKHLGWTVDKEVEAQRAARARLAVADASMNGASADVQSVGQEWFDMNAILTEYDTIIQQLYQWGVDVRNYRMPGAVSYVVHTDHGEDVKTVGPFAFPERMIASQALVHKGHRVQSYHDTVTAIKRLLTLREQMVQFTEKIDEWSAKYGERILPDAR